MSIVTYVPFKLWIILNLLSFVSSNISIQRFVLHYALSVSTKASDVTEITSRSNIDCPTRLGRNNNYCVYAKPHSDAFSWCEANKFLFLCISAACVAENSKYQLYSLSWWTTALIICYTKNVVQHTYMLTTRGNLSTLHNLPSTFCKNTEICMASNPTSQFLLVCSLNIPHCFVSLS
jgi:hypothetical protein